MRYSRSIAAADHPSAHGRPRVHARPIGAIDLPRVRDAGRHARVFVEQRLRGRVADRVVDDAKLVATELVNNAVVHGEGRITLRTGLSGDAVRVEVIDEGAGSAPAIRADAQRDAPGGRGLRIVETLSARWGTFEGTTHVWADIACAPATAG